MTVAALREGGVDVVSRDVVVIGAGIAGLTAALSVAPRSVAVVSKNAFGAGGSSVWAQGGIAAAVGPDDSPRLHAEDTLAVAGGLGSAARVEILAREGPQRVLQLLALGVTFDRDAEGRLALGREAAHSRRRILHARGDATGAELVRGLSAATRQASHIEVFEGRFAADLLIAGGRVVGVSAQGEDGRRVVFLGRAVVLATGGIGRVFLRTTNPPEATGDGLAMAARAGARLVDMEFVQFHPTALAVGADPMPLLTEALRGEGAMLIDQHGDRFMLEEHPDAELAPRDVVARAIFRRLAAGDQIFLDARKAVGEAFPSRFPTVFELCQAQGLDPRQAPMPVAPAAHYHMGGVAVDASGRASIPGLWACGEVSSTGVHGANRLASNSLLEAVVFGARVAEDLLSSLPAAVAAPRIESERLAPPAESDLEALHEVRRLMWDHVGVVRDRSGLAAALAMLDEIASSHLQPSLPLGNALLVGRLIAHAALAREESRGGHFRSDFPQSDPSWQRHLSESIDPGGRIRVEPGALEQDAAVVGRS